MKRIVVAFAIVVFAISANSQEAMKLCDEMLAEAQTIKTLAFTIKKIERVEGEIYQEVSNIRINRKPRKVYMKQISPKEGLEMLYVEGNRKNKAYINPNGFPWINVSLDPYGSTTRKDQHHTLFELGFDMMVNILSYLKGVYKGKTDDLLALKGSVKWSGRDCHNIYMSTNDFKWIEYSVKEGEDLVNIAKDKKVSAHMILEKNNKVKDYDDVKAGQKILIPTLYARKMTLYLDKENKMPIYMEVYDDQGLYEQYEYHNLKVNPLFPDDEFTEDKDEYNF